MHYAQRPLDCRKRTLEKVALSAVEFDEMLQQLATLLCFDLVDFDEKLAHLQLHQAPILLGFFHATLQISCRKKEPISRLTSTKETVMELSPSILSFNGRRAPTCHPRDSKRSHKKYKKKTNSHYVGTWIVHAHLDVDSVPPKTDPSSDFPPPFFEAVFSPFRSSNRDESGP